MQTPLQKHGKLSNHQISQIRIGIFKNKVTNNEPDFPKEEFS